MSERSEREKMLAGEPYRAGDAELVAARHKARRLCQQLNALPPEDEAAAQAVVEDLLGQPSNAYITPPFFCDYGAHMRLGKSVYFNANCVVLDVAPVTIGDHVLMGPAVQIYTALHPLDAAQRRSGVESGRPVVIGDDVWIGGAAVICPGVSIGARSVIGAGSVVTRDIPPDVFAAGNPCRVIRRIEPTLPREGERVRLRRLSPVDLQDFQAYRHDADLGRYQGWTAQPDPQALAFLDEMGQAPFTLAQGEWLQLGIAERAGGRLIGDLGLCRRSETEAEIGFTLAAPAQGQGLATEAVRLALQLLFVQFGLQRVIAITDARNSASIRLLQRLGARLERSEEAVFRGEACVEHRFVIDRE